MKKKYYIPLLLIGALLIFSLLPILNYSIDPWRVLHNDHENSYTGISANKSFLKVGYLLDNKNRYDTLFMGSSRSGYLDAGLVSKQAYNMKYNFGVGGMHLHNLKILLANKISIKNLWLGVNDYIIWKDPKDHESDYQRKTYKNDFIGKLDFYSFYLLKKIDNRDMRIFKDEVTLTKSYEITDPDRTNLKTARDREKNIMNDTDFWIKKMQKYRIILLGYDDNKYRINPAVNEIKEIKKLCDEHHIKLTVFMYPSFYKTYLWYNQSKIEEFKRKLSSVVDFHDFYALNHIAFNELNWIDTSHFTLSVGNYIIENIQKNTFLVTKKNVDTHIIKTRTPIKDLLHNSSNEIYRININIDIGLSSFKSIFNIKEKQYKYYTTNQFETSKDNDSIRMPVDYFDQTLILDNIKSNSQNVVLNYKVYTPHKTAFQIFYKSTKESKYNQKDSYIVYLEKGLNQFNLLIPSKYLNHGLRIDLANSTGTYLIKDFAIYEVK